MLTSRRNRCILHRAGLRICWSLLHLEFLLITENIIDLFLKTGLAYRIAKTVAIKECNPSVNIDNPKSHQQDCMFTAQCDFGTLLLGKSQCDMCNYYQDASQVPFHHSQSHLLSITHKKTAALYIKRVQLSTSNIHLAEFFFEKKRSIL